MEQEVARWFRTFGHPAGADQTSLSKSLAPTCRGNALRVWEFILSNAKSKDEASRIEDTVNEFERRRQAEEDGPSRQEECVVLRDQLTHLEAQAAAVERTIASYEVSRSEPP